MLTGKPLEWLGVFLAVDLIDWSYPGHSLADRLDRLSRRSLDGVGETVVQLAKELGPNDISTAEASFRLTARGQDQQRR